MNSTVENPYTFYRVLQPTSSIINLKLEIKWNLFDDVPTQWIRYIFIPAEFRSIRSRLLNSAVKLHVPCLFYVIIYSHRSYSFNSGKMLITATKKSWCHFYQQFPCQNHKLAHMLFQFCFKSSAGKSPDQKNLARPTAVMSAAYIF